MSRGMEEHTMINQYEVPAYIVEAFPEFEVLVTTRKNGNPYIAMHTLLEITALEVKEHNYRAVKHCFDLAAKLYDRGNSIVKNAVENVFVYSLTTIIQSARQDKAQLLGVIPITIYTLYIRQLYQAGC